MRECSAVSIVIDRSIHPSLSRPSTLIISTATIILIVPASLLSPSPKNQSRASLFHRAGSDETMGL